MRAPRRRSALRRHVDRLTFAGQIIETGAISYWLAHARAQRSTS
jgi:hypothetical protein